MIIFPRVRRVHEGTGEGGRRNRGGESMDLGNRGGGVEGGGGSVPSDGEIWSRENDHWDGANAIHYRPSDEFEGRPSPYVCAWVGMKL